MWLPLPENRCRFAPAIWSALPQGEGWMAYVAPPSRIPAHRPFCESGYVPAARRDRAARDQLGAADVDVVARPGAQRLHHQPGAVDPEVEEEAGFGEAGVEIGVAAGDLLIERALAVGHQAEGERGGDEVGLFGRHA